VRGLEPGQRVVAFPVGGSYAEEVLAPAVLTYPVPDDLPDEAVAGLTVLVTAYNVLTLAGRLRVGEGVLVHAAAGGVGSTAVQLARALGAGRCGSRSARASLWRRLPRPTPWWRAAGAWGKSCSTCSLGAA